MKTNVIIVLAVVLCSTALFAQEASSKRKWDAVGFRQANTMGGGVADISPKGVFRVFVLMGQSNMSGAARAKELTPPYNQKHDRIRIWANGRWEYFVPQNKFGPGVTLAHQLAGYWPEDTIGIIKVAKGGTGIRAFEKNWSFERADRTFDGEKGSFYRVLLNAVTEAKKISKPEFCGFVWNQGGADATKKDLAEEYFDTFKLLVADIREDLNTLELPVFVLTYLSDEKLQKVKAMFQQSKRPYLATVLMAHNRSGREISNTKTVHHGKLPVGKDGIHFNAEGQIELGKITASAIEKFYKDELSNDVFVSPKG